MAQTNLLASTEDVAKDECATPTRQIVSGVLSFPSCVVTYLDAICIQPVPLWILLMVSDVAAGICGEKGAKALLKHTHTHTHRGKFSCSCEDVRFTCTDPLRLTGVLRYSDIHPKTRQPCGDQLFDKNLVLHCDHGN